VVADGMVTHLALVFCHVAADGWAARTVVSELVAMLGDGEPGPATAPWTTLDQAAAEQSAEGAKRTRVALRHWRQALDAMPASLFDHPAAEPEPVRFHRLRLRSAAAATAAVTLAGRHRTSTSNVVLTAVGLVLAALSGRDTVALQLIVGNRHDERSRGLVSASAQNGLLVQRYDPAATVGDVIRATYRASTGAYFTGAYEPSAIEELLAETAARRGVYLDRGVYFNDARMGEDWTDTAAEITGELRRSTEVDTVATTATHDARFFAHLAHHPAECHLLVWVDTAYLPLDRAGRALRGVEELLVRAAREPLTVARVPDALGLAPPERGPDWVRTADGWVSLPAIAEIVTGVAGAPAGVVAGTDGNGLATVTATVAGDVRPADLHARVLAALDGRTGVRAPHHYRSAGEPR
jgi:hypothetical protein